MTKRPFIYCEPIPMEFDAIDDADFAYIKKAARNANDSDADSSSRQARPPTAYHALNFGDLP